MPERRCVVCGSDALWWPRFGSRQTFSRCNSIMRLCGGEGTPQTTIGPNALLSCQVSAGTVTPLASGGASASPKLTG
jgi:hypothetical protein